MKPRSTVTALLAVTASLLAAKAKAARARRVVPAGSAAQATAASMSELDRKVLVLRLKTLPSS